MKNMAYLCIFLLVFYSILITYQSVAESATNSEKRFLFVAQEKDSFSRRPSIIDFNSGDINSHFTGVHDDLDRRKRDVNVPISFRSDNSQPRNISVTVSTPSSAHIFFFFVKFYCVVAAYLSSLFFLDKQIAKLRFHFVSGVGCRLSV